MSPVLMALSSLLIGLAIGFFLSHFFASQAARAIKDERDRSQQELASLKLLPEKLAASTARYEAALQQTADYRLQITQLDHAKQTVVEQLHERGKLIAELEIRLQAERDQLAKQSGFIEQQMKSLQLQFEQQASRILEEKSQKFTEQNKTGLDTLLNPLREQIKDFREKVESAYGNEARERFALKEQINNLEALNRQISDEANNLTKALKGDKKLQGNWGEVVLSRVLKESGLREGHEYETQFSTKDEEGQRRLPDVVVHLPDNRDIVIDAKVSLVDYERYCSSEDTTEREQLLKQHTTAIRNHINALSNKKYEDLAEIRTLDFIFLFMPVEAAFMLAVEHDHALFSEAFSKRIIIVSPTTLLATLKTVESIWRYERQNQNAEKIALEAGRLHDKLASLLNHLQSLGNSLDQSRKHYDSTLSSLQGKGGLVSKVDALRLLGAKTSKKLPVENFDAESDNDTDIPPLPQPTEDN
jgi:DNA recombination protein RmuC